MTFGELISIIATILFGIWNLLYILSGRADFVHYSWFVCDVIVIIVFAIEMIRKYRN